MKHEAQREENRRIGAALRQRRKSLGLSQKEAAEKVHIDRGQFRRIESGEAALMASRVRDVCEGLGISPNELFSFEGKGALTEALTK